MDFRFDFTRNMHLYFIASGLIILAGLVVFALFGMNLGVDFQGGTRLDFYTVTEADQQLVEELVQAQGLSPSQVQLSGDKREYVTMRFTEDISREALAQLREGLKEHYGEEADIQESTVSPVVALEQARKAVIGLLVASVGIAAYILIRFEYRFAVSALVTLLHDALFMVAFFAIFRLEVDLPLIAAVLTVVGYSINDSIVIFDRIRENMKTAKIKTKEDLRQLLNTSIIQTLPRSINTLLTLLIMALGLFLFGAESIRLFSLSIVVGLICGGYSSIFIGSQLWFILRSKGLRAGQA